MAFSIKEVIDSYKQNFQSSVGAYAYMHLNQSMPEFFVLSSKNVHTEITDLCQQATSLNDIIKGIKNIDNTLFAKIQSENSENDLSQNAVLKKLRNISFLDIDWQQDNAWDELKGHIEFNHYSLFIDSNKAKEIQTQLSQIAESFGIRKISINPNFHPEEFVKTFSSGLKDLCIALNLHEQQIGLNMLEVNYKTEDGDFTGYMDSSNNKMVINKLEVFTHEWMHFIEQGLGMNGYALTDIMQKFNKNDFETFFPDLKQSAQFPELLNEKINDVENLNFSNAIASASHFFERYAIDKEHFYDNVKIIAEKTLEKIHADVPAKQSLDFLQTSIENLLSDRHPTRYFSFLKAQCDMEINRHANQQLNKNQFIDFSNKADKHLNQNNYTASLVETFARSFETYVFSKLPNSKLLAKNYDSDFYPQGESRQKFNVFWEKSWEQMNKELHNLCPRDTMLKSKSWSMSNIAVFREKFNKKTTSLKPNV